MVKIPRSLKKTIKAFAQELDPNDFYMIKPDGSVERKTNKVLRAQEGRWVITEALKTSSPAPYENTPDMKKELLKRSRKTALKQISILVSRVGSKPNTRSRAAASQALMQEILGGSVIPPATQVNTLCEGFQTDEADCEMDHSAA